MSTLESLNRKLELAREAYYAGNPVMSDAEYDVLEAQLAGLSDQLPEGSSLPSVLLTVGTDSAGRIPHTHPMRSIENFYTEADFVAWFRSHKGQKMSISSKWDGISASLSYRDGDLVQAVTRGDGDAGEDITAQVLASVAIPKSVPFPYNVDVRGELVIAQSTMERLNQEIIRRAGKPFMSTRNLVAGAMKLKDLAEVTKRDVQFMAWEIPGEYPSDPLPGSMDDSARNRLALYANSTGSTGPDDVLLTSETHLLFELRERLARLEKEAPEIGRDGFVLKIDSMAERRELGVGSKFANYQVCFKPQNAKGETFLREVIWQVGRQGRLTPVGVIEPLVLAGAVIERVSLNNLSWIRDMNLQIGSRVAVVRSGDVIPQITEVLG